MQLRVNVSSSPDTTSNYDYATKTLKTDGTFENNTQTNGTSVPVTPQRLLTGNSFGLNGILYIFNANNSSEYTFLTNEIASWRDNSNLTGGPRWHCAYSCTSNKWFYILYGFRN